MVQAIENWAWVTCRLVRMHDAGDHVELDVVVEASRDDDKAPNLLANTVGQQLTIKVKGPVPALAPDARFQLRARRAGPANVWGQAETIQPLP
jgi:flavin reductase (DIM6/NTAB) family NADH-FMN oxidoreductase RutF